MQLDNNAYIYDSHNAIISKIGNENRKDIKYTELSDTFKMALLCKEDREFYQHSGTSFRGIMRAAIYSLVLNKKQYGGGSTITNQLAKAILTRRNSNHIMLDKIREYFLSIKLEQVLSKNQIMTLYLNKIEYGNGTIGLKEACAYYYGKTPNSLTLQESAVLIGIINNPTKNNPVKRIKTAVRERNLVYLSLLNNNKIDTAYCKQLCSLSIVLTKSTLSNDYDKAFVSSTIDEAKSILKKSKLTSPKTGQPYDIYSDGIDIYTSLDKSLQSEANMSFVNALPQAESYIYDLVKSSYNNDDIVNLYQSLLKQTDEYKLIMSEGKSANMSPIQLANAIKQIDKSDIWEDMAKIDYGCIVLNKDNRIISYLSSNSNNNDYNTISHQMGSVVKPFIYHYGLQSGYNECDYLESKQRKYDEYFNDVTDSVNRSYKNNEIYAPRNYESSSDNAIYSYQGALAHSVNTITVQLYKALGCKNVETWIKSIGLINFNGRNMSACLGTDNNTPMNILQSYTRMIRNTNAPISAITKIVDNRNNRILYDINGDTTDKISKIKSLFTSKSKANKSNLYDETLTKRITAMLLKTSLTGTAKAVRLNGFKSDFACKTGTTQNSQNAWLVGVSPNISIIIWMGIKPNSIDNKVIVGGALPSLIASNILAYSDYMYNYENMSFNLKINACIDKIRPVQLDTVKSVDTSVFNTF
jgi:penicillin-binding protein 1A